MLLEWFNTLIKYDDAFYLVSRINDYNTKNIEGVTLFRLFPDGHDVKLYINIQTDRYQTVPLYRSDSNNVNQICTYLLVPQHSINVFEE